MSNKKIVRRACKYCLKEVHPLADKCPYCTADISKENYDGQIIYGLMGVFSSRKTFFKYFFMPFIILILIGSGIFLMGYLFFGQEVALILAILSIIAFGFYKMIKSI